MHRAIEYTTDYQIEEEQQEDNRIACLPGVVLAILLEAVGVLFGLVVWYAAWVLLP